MSGVEGWQTYRNDEFGFEVKHPGSFQLRKDEGTSIRWSEDPESFGTSLRIDITPTTQTPSAYVDQIVQERISHLFEGDPTFSVGERRSTFVAESPAIRLRGFYDPRGLSSFETYIQHPKSDSIISVELLTEWVSGKSPDVLIELENQILSTFRFVE